MLNCLQSVKKQLNQENGLLVIGGIFRYMPQKLWMLNTCNYYKINVDTVTKGAHCWQGVLIWC